MKLADFGRTVLVAAITLAAAAGSAHSPPAAGAIVHAGPEWIVLASDRDGRGRGYVMHADGSRLTPLLTRAHYLVPVVESADGGTIAYRDPRYGIAVSRANGTGLRRLVKENAVLPALSRDGRMLAYVTNDRRSTIWIVGTDGRGRRRLNSGPDLRWPDWSPDGRAIAFERDLDEDRAFVVVQPLRGKPRTLGGGGAPKWSPDGRWIAYAGRDGLYVVQPSGARRHRVVRAGFRSFLWSSDGRRLALGLGTGIAVVGVDRPGVRLVRIRGVDSSSFQWSPDGRLFALASGYPSQIWVVGADGRGLRRVTSRGNNSIVGWTRVSPTLGPARPVPPTERVLGRTALELHARVNNIAADGRSVAFVAQSTATQCHHVAAWTVGGRSVRRLPARVAAPCLDVSVRDAFGPVVLAGTRAAWVESGGGNTLEESVFTATFARPIPVEVGAAFSDDYSGTFLTGIAGHGTLIAFSIEKRCDPDNDDAHTCPPSRVVSATVYRTGGPGPCPDTQGRAPRACTPVASATGPLSVLSVDAGRIVVATRDGVKLFTSTGGTLRAFPLTASAAALSGNLLAVRTPGSIDIYAVDSGRPVAQFRAAADVRLEDLDGDVLVTAAGRTVTLRRLADGGTATVEAGGRAHAQLEPTGLFVAGGRRLTFTPMAQIVRLLGS